MATFMERLRAPGLRGMGFDGSETAGDYDILDQLASQKVLQGHLDPMGTRGMQGRNLAMRQPPNMGRASAPASNMGRAQGPEGPMNVVYDQRPEQFAKQMEQKDRQLDNQAEYNKALAGLKRGELDVKQQNADTNENRVAAIMARQDITDEEKLQLVQQNALELEGLRQTGRTGLEGQRQTGRMGLANTNNQARAGLAGTNNDAAMARLLAQAQAALGRQDDQQAATSTLPNNQRVDANNRARQIVQSDPEGATGISFNPQGDWTFTPNASQEFQARFNARMNGPGGSATPSPTPATGPTKFTANGKSYTIPPDMVAAFMAQNPTAQKVQ